jgi:hypothetical protein
MDAIGLLVSVMDRDRVARQPAEGTGCSLKDFYSHHLKVLTREVTTSVLRIG